MRSPTTRARISSAPRSSTRERRTASSSSMRIGSNRRPAGQFGRSASPTDAAPTQHRWLIECCGSPGTRPSFWRSRDPVCREVSAGSGTASRWKAIRHGGSGPSAALEWTLAQIAQPRADFIELRIVEPGVRGEARDFGVRSQQRCDGQVGAVEPASLNASRYRDSRCCSNQGVPRPGLNVRSARCGAFPHSAATSVTRRLMRQPRSTQDARAYAGRPIAIVPYGRAGRAPRTEGAARSVSD